MKINNIYLRNFGSYEGETIFETKAVDDRNIILIGGKNGAGKTTLFTAMRICLYGYLSMGYKNFNSFSLLATQPKTRAHTTRQPPPDAKKINPQDSLSQQLHPSAENRVKFISKK